VSSSQRIPGSASRRVRVVTLGCARNEVDSEELAARLEDGGWQLAAETEDAAVVLVNTCGFIQAAKQDSIDVLLEAAAGGAAVVAAGCLAERYGSGLAEAMPEAQILGFDDYEDIAARLDAVAAGQRWAAHEPRDRRKLLPLAPADRPGSPAHLPGHGQPAAGPVAGLPAQLVRLPPVPFLTCHPASRRCRARACCDVGWAAGRWRRSRSLLGAIAGARSAQSPPSAAPSCPGAQLTWWRRRRGWPITGRASWCS
jgi:hypothetical protein